MCCCREPTAPSKPRFVKEHNLLSTTCVHCNVKEHILLLTTCMYCTICIPFITLYNQDFLADGRARPSYSNTDVSGQLPGLRCDAMHDIALRCVHARHMLVHVSCISHPGCSNTTASKVAVDHNRYQVWYALSMSLSLHIVHP